MASVMAIEREVCGDCVEGIKIEIGLKKDCNCFAMSCGLWRMSREPE